MPKGKAIIFNPRSANGKHRIPNSILQVGASIHGKFDYIFIDGNRELDPWLKIEGLLKTGEIRYFCSTVMPGPQLRQAIPYTKKIKLEYPEVITIWGGYFASNQYKTSLQSGYVDYIINGPGDVAFPSLLDAIETDDLEKLPNIKNLIYKNKEGQLIKTATEALLDQDTLPKYPYDYLNQHYSLSQYLQKTFLGNKTWKGVFRSSR